jgi:nicotinamide-nucleotide amidase
MLKKKLAIDRTRRTLSFTVAARPESEVAETVSSALAGFQDVSVSYRAQPGEIEVGLEDWEKEGGNLAEAAEALREILGPWLVAEGDETLEGNLGIKLRSRAMTLAVAESCTGGMVGERITSVPGSSDYFMGGVVAYSYAIKEKLLDVDKKLLEKKGAVCEEVAEAMALGIKRLFSCDIGLSVTGVAGPGTGKEKEPVGSVAFGLASSRESLGWKFMLPGNRDMVRRVATTVLLAIALFYLRGEQEAIPHG